MSSHPTPDHIMQVGLGFWGSKTLLSAVEMELFTELGKGPEDLENIQNRLGLHPRSSRDFLDALVAQQQVCAGQQGRKHVLAAIGVAAHEAGHAFQDAQSYTPLSIRASLVPVANFGSMLA